MHLEFHSYKGSSAVKTTNKTTLEVYVTDKEKKARATQLLNRNLVGSLNLAYILHTVLSHLQKRENVQSGQDNVTHDKSIQEIAVHNLKGPDFDFATYDICGV